MSISPDIKKHRISTVWILPIVALCICGWLIYKSYQDAGITITVYFGDASGITPEKTQVMYMGLPIGIVKKLSPDLENNRVIAQITMDKNTKPYLVKDTVFWLVHPEVSADRIEGLETIISGSYIDIRKGISTTTARSFTALQTAPPISLDAPGLHLTLRAQQLRSIKNGSGIFFKNIKIGSVQSYTLEQETSVLLRCHILPQYSSLIHKDSRFYDASGITFSGALTNLKVHMESLSSLFIGGIVVSTPDSIKNSSNAENGDIFPLNTDYNHAKFGLPMTLDIVDGKNIKEGVTKVIYHGFEAGYVDRLTMTNDRHNSVTAHILLDPRLGHILRKNTLFWLVSPQISLNGIKNPETLLGGPYITFKPGDGDYQDSFTLSHNPEPQPPLRPGKTLVLTSSENITASPGTTVFYRNIPIGEVLKKDLSKDRKSIETTIFIEEKYQDLVSAYSVFVKTGGITIEASLAQMSFKTTPLLSLIQGGIDLINIENSKNSKSIEPPHIFPLFQNIEKAMASHPGIEDSARYLYLTTDQLDAYRIGTPILYKKVKVGEITGFSLEKDGGKIKLTCQIEKKYAHLINSRSQFYKSNGIRISTDQSGFSIETETLESIIAGGISFFTPPAGKAIKNFHSFPIHRSKAAAKAQDDIIYRVIFHNAENLSPGALVKYNGIRLGQVRTLRFTKDMTEVEAELGIEKQYLTLFREKTKIWLAEPRISLQGVKNLKAAVFGAHLCIEPGPGELTRSFIGLERPPQQRFSGNKGLTLILEAEQLNSITIGSPVYYRWVKIGEVTGYDLDYDFKQVLITLNINERYTPIIRQNTKFWNISGLQVKGGLFSGLAITTQSLDTLLAGGIALATPEAEEMGGPVGSGQRFILYDQPEEGWQSWTPDILSATKRKKNANETR